jgi:hypothetical protein
MLRGEIYKEKRKEIYIDRYVEKVEEGKGVERRSRRGTKY